MNRRTMLKRLIAAVDGGPLLQDNERVVLAISGGPDSMAMLHGLFDLNRERRAGWALHVAHLNHRIRGPEADEDASFVEAKARELGLACTVESEDVPSLAEASKRSLEETARIRRYAFFERVCLRTESRVAAVGHHADDNAETILHHIIRGTGLRGLAGMESVRPLAVGREIRLIRPMLGFRRAELKAYLDKQGIPYRHDRTNESDEHTRNRLRRRVLPMLRDEFNPQVDEALLRLAEQARWFEDYLETTAARTFEALIVSRSEGGLVLNVQALLTKSPILQTEVIRRAIMSFWAESAYRGVEVDYEVGFQHLRAVVELATSRSSGRQLSMPGGITVSRRYRRLIFSLRGSEAPEVIASEIVIACPGRTVLPVRGLENTTDVADFDYGEWPALRHAKRKSQEWVDYDKLRPPLIVRPRREGDRFWPLGAPGSKKLSDFFIDSKVSPEDRDRAAILCDQVGPVYVIGHRLDQRVRLERGTKRALKIDVKPLQSAMRS